MNSLQNFEHLVPAGYIAALVILLMLTVFLVWLFIRAVQRDLPRIESHWGGLGGGLGGWEISASFAYFVAAVCFAILSITVLKNAAEFYVAAQGNRLSGPDTNTGQAANTANTAKAGSTRNTGSTRDTGSTGNTGNTPTDAPRETADTAKVPPADQTKK
jgi:hypothetical protein